VLERLLRKVDEIITGQEEIKERLTNLERGSDNNNDDKSIDPEFLKVKIQVL
jgi:hypothetical protein